MKLSEQLEVITSSARIRIMRGFGAHGDPVIDKDIEVLFCGYKSMLIYEQGREWLSEDPPVRKLQFGYEVRHRQYEERGLFPPYEPEITRKYESKDLTTFLYYDIFI